MDKDVIILLVNGFCVIVTVYCFVSDYYVIALVGMVSNFFLSFYKLIFGRYFFSIGIKAKNNKNYKMPQTFLNKANHYYLPHQLLYQNIQWLFHNLLNQNISIPN